MKCLDFQNLVQRRLDGDRDVENGAFAKHLVECADCRSWNAAATQLLTALKDMPEPNTSPLLARRIVYRVSRERRRYVSYRRLAVAAVAASLLLAVTVGYRQGWFRGGPSSDGTEIVQLKPPPEPASSLRANVEDAVQAITGIVNQTAERTLEPGRVLFPDRTAAAFLTGAAALQAPKTTMPSLLEAGQGVTEFAPVAGFGRFINYFSQDIPGVERDRKSRS